ncbi:hypothetical protein [Arcobacter sp. F2176]|uniref:hypothetical protein n=1 Tax=Arcobacter sp. F2176 TaxID=2044511 RepID=UPI00100AFBB6|nr:hypothetical protein [Arcobacter sp. F2176]RXJ82162.1 hypothetical protein CRU95_04555 [Arcobacter sp. F2176]
MIKNLILMFSIVEQAKIKAFANAFIIPFFLTMILKNILFVVVWWVFIYLIYKFVFTDKKLNKLYFIRYVKYCLVGLGCIALILIVLVLS